MATSTRSTTRMRIYVALKCAHHIACSYSHSHAMRTHTYIPSHSLTLVNPNIHTPHALANTQHAQRIQMVALICGQEEEAWQAAEDAAIAAMTARVALWDGALLAVQNADVATQHRSDNIMAQYLAQQVGSASNVGEDGAVK